MGIVQRFERRVNELVNGAFARAFKSEVQPVEIASALQRECDDRAAIVSRSRTMAPNVYYVELSPADHDRLSVYAEALCAELSAIVREHAAEQAYTLVGPVQVHVERKDDLDTGLFRVRSRAIAGTASREGREVREVRETTTPEIPPHLDVDGAKHELYRDVTVVGRGADVDIRIDDPGVSRRHAEIRRHPEDRDVVLVVDLGSTNGVLLEGERVPRVELRNGGSVVLGNTTVVYRTGTR